MDLVLLLSVKLKAPLAFAQRRNPVSLGTELGQEKRHPSLYSDISPNLPSVHIHTHLGMMILFFYLGWYRMDGKLAHLTNV